MKYIIPFVALLILCSCEDDDPGIEVNLNKFDQITENYPYQNLQPNTKVDYLELSSSIVGIEEENILFSSGQKCLNASDQSDCESEFDSFKNETEGFDVFCGPICSFKYVKYQRGDVIDFLNTTNELITFLGDIDSESDAILLAISEGYYFSIEEKELGAIRKTSSGYKLLVGKTVSKCLPIQTNRFLLEITTKGEIKILQEEVYSSRDGVCI